MYSIRDRLNYTIIAGMIVVLTAAGLFLYDRVSAQVESVFDRALYDKVRAMISLTEMDNEGVEFDFAREDVMPEFKSGTDPQYYELWSFDDESPVKSPTLEENALPRLGASPEQHRFADLVLPDGRQGRVIEVVFMPHVEGEKWQSEEAVDDGIWSELPTVKPITLVYARERETLDATLLAIGYTIFGVVVGVLLLAALIVHRFVGSGLAPLSRLAARVGDIDESSLDLRLTHDGPQSVEIAPIENQLNHLLERLQSAFEREKRFSSNVAHELRTPLSELKTLAEVGRMLPDDRHQVDGFFRDVVAISEQMEKVVVTLLELTRSEAGLLRDDPEDIELSRFCDEVWDQVVNGQGDGRKLVKRIPADLVVNTDRDKLGMILGNLFVNAVSYSPEDAEVGIDARIGGKGVILEIRNAVQDLKPEDIVHMKDRFWRKHKEHQNSRHSGLGLTLVVALARIMKLDIDLQLDRQHIFMVTVSGLQPSLPR